MLSGRHLLLPLLAAAALPTFAQTLTGPNGSASVAFWYLGQNNVLSNVTSCCSGLTNLYYASSTLYLPSSYTNPSFSSSPSGSWWVDTSTRTSVGSTTVSYLIKALNPPTAGWESVSFTQGGFTSNSVLVYVNAPTSLVSAPIEPASYNCSAVITGPVFSGWVEIIYDSVYDRFGWVLTPIDTHETLENFIPSAGGQGWPMPNTHSASAWPASVENQQNPILGDVAWSTATNRFPDHYGECSAGNVTPAPVAYMSANPPVPVESFTQKFFVGTQDSGIADGVCVVRQAVTFYTDRGTDSNVWSPPGPGSCNLGSYANNN